MAESLWPQLRLKADTEEELIEKYRKVYLETYVYDENGNARVFTDWCGVTYKFGAGAFDHAFTESTNYRTSAGIHDGGFSKKRARRIMWIKEVLAHQPGRCSVTANLVKPIAVKPQSVGHWSSLKKSM